MTLNRASKRIAIKKAKEEALTEMLYRINSGLALQMELVMLLVLHDKFGFGAKRARDAIAGFEDLWDSVTRQYLTLDDIAATVAKEVGLVIDEETLVLVKGEVK